MQAAQNLTLPPGSVNRERHDSEHGRPDIVINAPGFYVVLENKLEAGWHDRDKAPQAVSYREFGLKHRSASQLGLVLLTNRDSFELELAYADYVRIRYRDLARALRRNLRSVISPSSSMAALTPFWPALLTVAAIEQELLGLDIKGTIATAHTRSWRSLRQTNEILTYLREER